MPLDEYRKKRDFKATPEPAPGAPAAREGPPTFVIHKHDASRMHYDLRLEIDGALASWSVPRGPSYDPEQKRLAVQVEDHPLEYGTFEGRIPDGHYGAGDSLLWDRGVWETLPPGQAQAMREKGHLRFVLLGEKLKGEWHLVRTRTPEGTRAKQGDSESGGTQAQWLFFKGRDHLADPAFDVVVSRPESVVSGRVVTRGPVTQATLKQRRPPPEALLAAAGPVEAPQGSGRPVLAAVASGRAKLQGLTGPLGPALVASLEAALARLVIGDALLLGEVVEEGEPVLIARDLLRLDGEDLRAKPERDRRDLLESVFANVPRTLRTQASARAPEPRAAAPGESATLSAADRFENLQASLIAGARADAGKAPRARTSPASTPAPASGPAAAPASAPAPAPAPASAPPSAPTIKLRGPSKALWTKPKLTRAQLWESVRALQAPLLAVLAERTIEATLFPEGADKPGRALAGLTADALGPGVVLHQGRSASGALVVRPVVESLDGLVWLVNEAALELRALPGRRQTPTIPDAALFAIEDEGARSLERVVEVAQALRGMFDRLGFPCLPLSTGRAALHLLVPLAQGHTFADAAAFARAVGATVARQMPEVELRATRAGRAGQAKLVLDVERNTQDTARLVPWWPRALPGAPLTLPLLWDEVGPSLDPSALGFEAARERLERLGDLHAAALAHGARLPRFS